MVIRDPRSAPDLPGGFPPQLGVAWGTLRWFSGARGHVLGHVGGNPAHCHAGIELAGDYQGPPVTRRSIELQGRPRRLVRCWRLAGPVTVGEIAKTGPASG